MSSRGRNPSFPDDPACEEEHDFDENTSVDSGNQYYFPSWSVTGRRGRKAKEPSKDSNSTTIMSNVMGDKGKNVIVTDQTSEADMSIMGLEIKNSIFPHQMVPLRLEQENINLDLSLSIATGSNVSMSYVISVISSGRGQGKSILDKETTEGKIKKASEQVGDEKAYVCKFCGKSFSKHEALGGHMTCHSTRKSKAAIGGPADGSQSSTAGGDRVEESNKLHECNICHRVFGTGQQLGGHKRAHYEGSLRTSSLKRAKYSAHGSSSTGTAVCGVSSSESIVGKAPVIASSSDDAEMNTSVAASAASGIDLNDMPPGEE